jgi:predicted kinase
MINLKKQTIVIIDGPMGSGKTTISKILHKKVKNFVYLSTDKIKWLQSDFSRSDRDIDVSLKVLLSMARTYLNEGFNLLIEENFIDKKVMEKFISLSKNKKTKLLVYHLEVPKNILLSRIYKRSKNHEKKGIPPLSKSFILKNLKTHRKHENSISIDGQNKSQLELAKIILKDLRTKISKLFH